MALIGLEDAKSQLENFDKIQFKQQSPHLLDPNIWKLATECIMFWRTNGDQAPSMCVARVSSTFNKDPIAFTAFMALLSDISQEYTADMCTHANRNTTMLKGWTKRWRRNMKGAKMPLDQQTPEAESSAPDEESEDPEFSEEQDIGSTEATYSSQKPRTHLKEEEEEDEPTRKVVKQANEKAVPNRTVGMTTQSTGVPSRPIQHTKPTLPSSRDSKFSSASSASSSSDDDDYAPRRKSKSGATRSIDNSIAKYAAGERSKNETTRSKDRAAAVNRLITYIRRIDASCKEAAAEAFQHQWHFTGDKEDVFPAFYIANDDLRDAMEAVHFVFRFHDNNDGQNMQVGRPTISDYPVMGTIPECWHWIKNTWRSANSASLHPSALNNMIATVVDESVYTIAQEYWTGVGFGNNGYFTLDAMARMIFLAQGARAILEKKKDERPDIGRFNSMKEFADHYFTVYRRSARPVLAFKQLLAALDPVHYDELSRECQDVPGDTPTSILDTYWREFYKMASTVKQSDFDRRYRPAHSSSKSKGQDDNHPRRSHSQKASPSAATPSTPAQASSPTTSSNKGWDTPTKDKSRSTFCPQCGEVHPWQQHTASKEQREEYKKKKYGADYRAPTKPDTPKA